MGYKFSAITLCCFLYTIECFAIAPREIITASKRPLSDPAIAIICLHAASRPMRFGHSAITTFIIDKKYITKNLTVNSPLTSSKAHWVGFWPFRKKDNSDVQNSRSYLPYNHDDDFFKKFEKDEKGKRGARHCVPVTQNELIRFSDFLAQKKSNQWWLFYNCNDLSTEAFGVATGIQFKPRALRTAACSHPATLVELIEEYQRKLPTSDDLLLEYIPNQKREIYLLKKYLSSQFE